jgi:hypothetical protein
MSMPYSHAAILHYSIELCSCLLVLVVRYSSNSTSGNPTCTSGYVRPTRISHTVSCLLALVALMAAAVVERASYADPVILRNVVLLPPGIHSQWSHVHLRTRTPRAAATAHTHMAKDCSHCTRVRSSTPPARTSTPARSLACFATL